MANPKEEPTRTPASPGKSYTYIIEHLDPELETWQSLEYTTIHAETLAANSHFLLSGLSPNFQTPLPSTHSSVESRYSTPEARSRVCLLDPRGEKDLSPEDGELFDVFLFGGILGDDPPQDRTGELRKLGFVGRRLGAEQMTTDTAVRVTRMVVQEGYQLNGIPYVNRPDFEIPKEGGGSGPSETVSMPFKYVKGQDGKPILPEGMLELLASDADKGIMDLL